MTCTNASGKTQKKAISSFLAIAVLSIVTVIIKEISINMHTALQQKCIIKKWKS